MTSERKCKIPTCQKMRAWRSCEYCKTHYARWKRTGKTSLTYVQGKVCSVEGCGLPHAGKSYCRNHYAQWKRTGDPIKPERVTTCREPGCGGVVHAMKRCRPHYNDDLRRRRAAGEYVRPRKPTWAEAS